jgi:hypothetical protein
MVINCDPSCYLLDALNSHQIKRAGNRWEWAGDAVSAPAQNVEPARDSSKNQSASVPAKPNSCRAASQPENLAPIRGDGERANDGNGETPVPGKDETPQDTRCAAAPSEPQIQTLDGIRGNPESSQLEAHQADGETRAASERVPQEAEPLDALQRAMLEDGIIAAGRPIEIPSARLPSEVKLVDSPRDPSLDWTNPGPGDLRQAPKVMKPPVTFMFAEGGDFILRRNWNEFTLNPEEAKRFAQFWISLKDSVTA